MNCLEDWFLSVKRSAWLLLHWLWMMSEAFTPIQLLLGASVLVSHHVVLAVTSQAMALLVRSNIRWIRSFLVELNSLDLRCMSNLFCLSHFNSRSSCCAPSVRTLLPSWLLGWDHLVHGGRLKCIFARLSLQSWSNLGKIMRKIDLQCSSSFFFCNFCAVNFGELRQDMNQEWSIEPILTAWVVA